MRQVTNAKYFQDGQWKGAPCVVNTDSIWRSSNWHYRLSYSVGYCAHTADISRIYLISSGAYGGAQRLVGCRLAGAHPWQPCDLSRLCSFTAVSRDVDLFAVYRSALSRFTLLCKYLIYPAFHKSLTSAIEKKEIKLYCLHQRGTKAYVSRCRFVD